MAKTVGKIAVTPKGEFSAELEYEILDAVKHNGSLYISRIHNNRENITNESAWMLAVEKGEKGEKGETFIFDDLTPMQIEQLKGDVIAYNSLSETDKNDLAARVPVNGIVAEGVQEAVSGNEVWNSQRITLTNSMLNGDFSDGLTSYNVGSNITDATVSDGILSFTGKGQINVSANQIFDVFSLNNTDVYYVQVVAKSDNNASLYVGQGLSGTGESFYLKDTFDYYSIIASQLNNRIKIGGSVDGNVQVDYIIAINLTQVFGTDIPSKDELDGIMKSVDGYFTSKEFNLTDNIILTGKKADSTELEKVNTDLKKSVGIEVFNVNDNIAPELFNTDFDDTNVWGAGFYDSDGNIQSSTNTYYTKKLKKIVRGSYVCNLLLASNGMAVVLYDENGEFVKSYTNKSASDWTITADVDGYIGFSKLKSLASTQNYCKTLQSYVGDVTSDVFLKSGDAENVITGVIKPYVSPFVLNVKNGFDSRAVKSIKIISGNESQLKDSSGNWLRLFLTFIRITNFDSTPTTIVQIAKWNEDTNNVGNSNISVSNYGGTIGIDNNGLLTITTESVAQSGLSFKMILDSNYLRKGVDTTTDLLDRIELNTAYLYGSSGAIKDNPNVNVVLGDSLVEFENYPYYLGLNLNASFLNAGIGGTRMAYHESATYGELSFYKIAEAIFNEDFTDVNNAIDAIIPTVSTPRQNRLTRTRNNLNNTDWSKVTNLVVSFGTNDFTANNPIGDISLTNFDTTTLVGAFNYGVDKILSKHPQIKLYVTTPMFRYVNNVTPEGNSDFYENTLDLKVIDYVDAIVKIANMNHLPVKDMYRESGFNKYNHHLYYIDTTHHNTEGAKEIGNILAGFIKSKRIA